jgi:uncharacterized protein YndB with AHSA1/START domain
MVTLCRTAELQASPEMVWSVLLDTSGWPRWAPVRSVVIEQAGDDDTVGEIRELKTWGGSVRERVTAAERHRRLSYELLSGAPVRNYRGSLTLEPSQMGTTLTWGVEFDAPWYSRPILGLVVSRTIARTARGLANELARR